MAQQEDGWPLGLLQPMNARVIGLGRNHDRNGSISFSTLITGSPPSSSTDSTSDLDSQSTGSFFRDRSITLGSLMGVSSILELSRRSMRGRPSENQREKKNCKSKPWLFSLCSKLNTDAVSMSNGTPSLGHFLESERRAATTYRRNPGPLSYRPDDFSQDPNTLFVSGHVVPAQSSSWLDSHGEKRSKSDLFENGNGYGAPLLLSCLCGQLIE